MEFVENGNLEDLLLGDLTSHPIIEQWECRIRMALDVATGMNFLHKLEPPIIHRDLKTANVLVDIRYCCKISDFGLSTAHKISAQSTRSVSQQQRSSAKARYQQTPAGTLAFVAPELFTRGVGNAESDVYSYSIILWQLKEMKIPYPAGS
jgi:serine/threonine protein kinase